MESTCVALLKQQLRITWMLAEEVLAGLTQEEALWVPSPDSYTVRQLQGIWVADWAEPEPNPAPPTSIAWVQWHIIWWMSMVINHSFGDAQLQRQDVAWPGTTESLAEINRLRLHWIERLDQLTEAELESADYTHWPYQDDRPFALVAGWVNIELMKNVAEMASLRRSSPLYSGGRFTPNT